AVEAADAAIRGIALERDLATGRRLAVAIAEAGQAGQHTLAREAFRRLAVRQLDAGVVARSAVADVPAGVDALTAAFQRESRAEAVALVADLALEAGVSADAAVIDAASGVHAGAVAGLEPAVA